MNVILLNQAEYEELKRFIKETVEESVKKLIQPKSRQQEGYVTRKELAKHLKISLPTLHEYTKSGILPGYRIGGRVLYKLSEVEQSLQKTYKDRESRIGKDNRKSND